jgi:hypothetical protein
MADVEISYNGDTILSMSDSGTEYLDTKGMFMADNITVQYNSPTLVSKSVTANGTYNASSDNADGYSSVTVNVSGGGVTTVSFSDEALFGADKVIYVDGTGTVQITSGYLAMYSACSYQMQSGSIIVMFGDLVNGGAQYVGVPNTITLVQSGTMSVSAAPPRAGTLSWSVFQVN